MGVYKMMASAPPHSHDKEGILDPMQHLFSFEARDDLTDLSIGILSSHTSPTSPSPPLSLSPSPSLPLYLPIINLFSAHIMVNSMAVCVGSPRDSNHVYYRAFDLTKLERTKGPGSDFHHENWDCGVSI